MSFLTIGHRGLMGVEPENTLRSFVRAEQEGLDVIELDLHLSSDGALVVMHDPTVDRTTDGTGPISEQSLDQLRKLDAGRGEQIPVFEEVVDATTAPLQAEIKDVAAARALAEVITRRDLTERVTVISFHDDAVSEISRLLPGIRTGLVASRYGENVVDRATAVDAHFAVLNLRRLTLSIVDRLHEADILVAAWVVNTPRDLLLARTLGVDAATTDVPDVKRAVEGESA